MDSTTIFSVVVLAAIFLSLPVTVAWLFLNSRLERIRASGHGRLGCVLRYIAQGLGLPIVIVAAVCGVLMLLAVGAGPAWIWPFFFSGLITYFAVGWCLAWLSVGLWSIVRSVFLATKAPTQL